MTTGSASHKDRASRTPAGRAAPLHGVLILAALLAFTLGGIPSVGAETITWNNPAGGVWNLADNWDPLDVPNEHGEDALFSAGGGIYATTLNASVSLDSVEIANQDATLIIDAGRTLTLYEAGGLNNSGIVTLSGTGVTITGNIFNNPSANVLVPAGMGLDLRGPTVTNNGTFTINPTGDALDTYLQMHGNAVTFVGNGEIILRTAGDYNHARIEDYSSGALIQGTDHTIRGEGLIEATPFTNNGLVDANVSERVLHITSGTTTNNGTMKAEGGGILEVGSSTITQDQDGLIMADGGQVLLSSSANISGGTLSSDNGGVIQCTGAGTRIDNLSNLGQYEILPACRTDVLGGTITNQGTFAINPTGDASDAYLRMYGNPVTFDGSGEIVLRTAGDYNDARIEDYSGGALTQGTDHTIRGEGLIEANPFTNNGLVDANVSERVLHITSGTTTNNGTLKAEGGGILEVGSSTITQGQDGLIMADGGWVHLSNAADISGGTLSSADGGVIQCTGAGTSIDNLSNLGQYEILPGCGTDVYGGTITNNGTFTINSTQGDDNAYLKMWAAEVVFDGSGEIVLQTGGDPADAQISRYGSGRLVQGPNHTIRGEGLISTPMTNNGLVEADVPDRELQLTSTAKTNNGTMEAVGGGTLHIHGGAITQGQDGLIMADGGWVHLSNAADISGGTLSSANGGAIQCVGAGTNIDNLSNLGQYEILPACGTDVHGGTITNTGTFTINSTQGDGDAYLKMWSSEVTFDGNGEIVLQTNGDPADAQISDYGSGRLVQGPNHTIRGEGLISTPMTNNGLVEADVPDRELQLTSTAKTNNGTMEAVGGGTLHIHGGAITQGQDGLIMADGGWVHLTASADISGGTLSSANGGAIQCVGAGTNIDNLSNLGQYEILPACGTDVHGGTITNTGTFTINSTQGDGDAYLKMWAAEVVFDGSGEIVLQTNGNPADAQISDYGSGRLVQGPNHTIRGEGRISAPLTNNGLVQADVPDRELQLTSTAKTNNGVMRATGSMLSNTAASFTNNGTIAAADSGLFRTSSLSGNYSGGTLTGGTWQVFEYSTMRLIGGNIQTLAATVLLDGLESNLYSDDATTDALANFHTITEGGMLEIANGRDYATPGDLTVDRGGITVGEGCTFTVNGQYTQLGNEEDPNLPGYTCVNGTLIATTDPIDIQGGRLCGSGTVQNSVISNGRVNPGASAGELTITGDYTQTEEGTCWIELAGLNIGEYDHLLVGGDATLAGRLVVTSIEGYEPNVGDRFTILTCASRTGEFTLETGSPGVGLIYETYYYTDHIEIEIHGDPSYVSEPEIADDTPGTPGDEGESDPGLEPDDPFNTPELIPTALNLYSRPQAGGGALLVLDLPQAAQVTLELFDFNGRRVAILQSGLEAAGRRIYAWSGMTQAGARAASGVYLARARVTDGGNTDVMQARLLLVR